MRLDFSQSMRAGSRGRDQVAIGLLLVIVGALYAYLASLLLQAAGAVAANLLPGYAPAHSAWPIKREFVAFVLLQLGFAAALALSWAWTVFVRRSVVVPFMPLAALGLAAAALTGALLTGEPLVRFILTMAVIFLIAGASLASGPAYRLQQIATGCAFSLIGRIARWRWIRPTCNYRLSGGSRFALTAAGVLVCLVMFWPVVRAWYPVVLPSDYYEVRDSFKLGEGGGTSGREALAACLLAPSDQGACEGAEKLRQSFIASSIWQGETGRLYYHHSYIFVPAKHWLKHGWDNAVPFLYGYGNTIFYALLMATQGGNISSYFLTYPIAVFVGIFSIAACAGYCAGRAWIGIAAFILCLTEIYSINFEAVFLAASFNPIRYSGLALQIASVFYVTRGSPKRVLAIPSAAALSLFWNMEFAVLGLVGQCLILLSPTLRLSHLARISAGLAVMAALAVYLLLARTSPSIVSSIFLGFFQVNMPFMTAGRAVALFTNVFVFQAMATAFTFTYRESERDSRLAVLPVIALALIKTIFNPSPQHASITLAFMLPMSLIYLPRFAPKASLAEDAVKLAAIGGLAIICWHAGMKYIESSLRFRKVFIEPFVAEPWSGLGETVPAAVPRLAIAERVEAISRAMQSEDSLLLLSPFDHLLAFYANPVRYCGHFELISNIATQQNIDQVVDCARTSPNLLVVYDKRLIVPCPDVSKMGITPVTCPTKLLAKGNAETIFQRLLPELVESGRDGDLIFYRRRPSAEAENR